MTLSYDRNSDTLYIVFERFSKECDYIEEEPGIILRVNPKTGKVVGCTILSFTERFADNGQLRIAGMRGAELAPRLAKLFPQASRVAC